MIRRIGHKSLDFGDSVYVASRSAIGGKAEGDGPLCSYFDEIVTDEYFGQKSFEDAESELLRRTVVSAFSKIGKMPDDADVFFCGDLENQCVGSSYAMTGFSVPYLGIYGACSTMSEGLLLSASSVAAGVAELSANATASHFCTAERQFRFPLEYGGQKPPYAQWTATASGCIVLSGEPSAVRVRRATVGKIVDKGICDAANMGAAMAPAFADTVLSHFSDTGLTPSDYDLIVSGDLGSLGSSLALDLLSQNGLDISSRHFDCGKALFDPIKTDVHAGGSGCGCSAAVLSGYLLNELERGRYSRILFCATGALMSAGRSRQGKSIPGICHAVSFELVKFA